MRRSTKAGLLALRLLAIAAAVVCLLRPTLQVTHYDVVKRPLLVLVDESRSMTEVRDVPGGLTRLQGAHALLKRNELRLKALEDSCAVNVLPFARRLLTQAAVRADEDVSRSTYGQSLEQAFFEVSGAQGDAVLVLGDGAHNGGPPDPVDVAAALNQQGVPVYTIGVGQDEATAPVRDADVADVSAPTEAMLYAAFKVRPQVLFRGYRGQQAKVKMTFGTQAYAERGVTLAHNEEWVPLEFEVVPEREGEQKLRVSVEPLPGEALRSNNSYTTYVRVTSAGVRVGFLDIVRPESKFIARALTGAPQLALRRVLILSGQTFPDAQADADLYDVMLVADAAPSAMPPSRLTQLRAAVQEQGKGLVVLLSQESAGLIRWSGTPLEDLLPVKLGHSVGTGAGPRRFQVDREVTDHPAVALGASREESLAAWGKMPPLAGVVVGVEPKRGATVLAHDEEGHPLLVVHRSGRGRVACLLADTTHRWFFTGAETQDLYRRFWRQLVLWAAAGEEQPRDRLRLELTQRNVRVGDSVGVSVRLTAPDGEPLRDAPPTVRVVNPEGEATTVPCAYRRTEGTFAGEYRPGRAGEYTVAAEALEAAGPTLRDQAHFEVSAADMELEDPSANFRLLRRMAAATADAGGEFYPLAQADQLFSDLRQRAKPLTLSTRRRRDVWDSWALFAAATACLAAEWSVRKWRGLV